ncbi:MAG: diphthamide synthesis protein [archaeon]
MKKITKRLFIPAKSRVKLNKSKIEEVSKKLPKEVAIVYSIQFQELAFEVEKSLTKNHKITFITQVLGCSNPKFPKQTQAILLIGSGKFHASSLALNTSLPIYILNSKGLEKVSEKDIKFLKNKQKFAKLKFLNADKIGILVSTKPGQQNLEKAINIKKKIKNKKTYLFLDNNINTQEFENFKIDSWINTACPRLDMDSSVINMEDL